MRISRPGHTKSLYVSVGASSTEPALPAARCFIARALLERKPCYLVGPFSVLACLGSVQDFMSGSVMAHDKSTHNLVDYNEVHLLAGLDYPVRRAFGTIMLLRWKTLPARHTRLSLT